MEQRWVCPLGLCVPRTNPMRRVVWVHRPFGKCRMNSGSMRRTLWMCRGLSQCAALNSITQSALLKSLFRSFNSNSTSLLDFLNNSWCKWMNNLGEIYYIDMVLIFASQNPFCNFIDFGTFAFNTTSVFLFPHWLSKLEMMFSWLIFAGMVALNFDKGKP